MLQPDKRRAVDELRSTAASTYRATVPALEALLYEPVPVLDHGFVRVIDYMGDDAAVVQAARVSYGRGTKRARDDASLLCYLMRHQHTTPFEMCEIKYHIKLPIFVARQWIRHRTANVNEYSGRYSVLDNEYYLPVPADLAAQSTANRQGRGKVLDADQAAQVLRLLREDAERAYAHYQALLNEEREGSPRDPERDGLARELARMNLSLNFYTQWYWKVDLHNLFHFLELRLDAQAQAEIRAYARVLFDTVQQWVPICTEAFLDYQLNGVRLSAKGLDVVRRLLAQEPVTQESSGLSAAEWRELLGMLQVAP